MKLTIDRYPLSLNLFQGLLAVALAVSPSAAQVQLPAQDLVVFMNKTGPTMPINAGRRLAWPLSSPRPLIVSAGSEGLDEPVEFAVGPDGRFYVSSAYQQPSGRVLCFEYDGTPNTTINTELALYATQSGLVHPTGLAFGPDNRLYVADTNTGNNGAVFCYRLNTFFSGSSGWTTLAAAPANGMGRPGYLTLRPATAGTAAGNLLVGDYQDSRVKEYVIRTSASYNGSNEGTFVGDFLSGIQPANLLYGADGSLYVAITNSNVVNRYDGLGATGMFLSQFAPTPGNSEGLDSPQGLAFGPDGMLYIGGHGADRILRYRLPASNLLPGIFDAVYASGLGDPGAIHFRDIAAAGTSFCEGASIAPQCCGGAGGSPAQNHGCPNSANASGAQLLGTYNQFNLGEVRLSSWGMPATTVCMFLQSATPLSPVIYGDGARCLGAPIKRIAAKPISNGAAAYPEAGDPDIRTRSATLGDTIPLGGVRYYQAYYRESNSPCGGGHSFNLSSGYVVTWW